MTTTRGRVLLIEDEEILRTSLSMFLNKSGFEVVEAEDEAGALSRLQEDRFNLIITDLFLADGSGFGIMKYLQDYCQEAKCIVITGHASLDSAIRALRKGAFDYLLKPFEYDELKAAVDRAIQRQSEERLIKKLDYQQLTKAYGLTKKELEITKVVISEGLSNADISESMGISKNTVKVHLRNIFKKVGVESKTALTTMLLSGSSK
ncbi:MAG TPA: response regulator transcription factor [Nitrospirota bacterium]|nr:response regulator transcription factor [Nitrospirota bacterium]